MSVSVYDQNRSAMLASGCTQSRPATPASVYDQSRPAMLVSGCIQSRPAILVSGCT